MNSNTHEGTDSVQPAPPTDTTAPARESHLRSALKALSWRIVATSTTGLIAYCLLVAGAEGDSSKAARQAVSIAGIEFVLKFFIYYGHERLWQLVPRGAIRQLYQRAG